MDALTLQADSGPTELELAGDDLRPPARPSATRGTLRRGEAREHAEIARVHSVSLARFGWLDGAHSKRLPLAAPSDYAGVIARTYG